ncbi:hypothetical protein [Candidatus Leptofilum sp.]|uniref:hypothetical protein n=1 Tax=Candidatus Leptofilum sp. TaxID=3241576 RepID=UPI003B5B3306
MSNHKQNVKLNELEMTAATILGLLNDQDDVVAVRYLVGNFLTFMPVKNFEGNVPRFENLEKSLSQVENRFTRFDDLSFSQRSKQFRDLIVNRFSQKYLATSEAQRVLSEMSLSEPATEVVYALFNSKDNLESFIQAPEAFINAKEDEVHKRVSAEERAALMAIANDEKLLWQEFDQASLGDADGDGDTYILIGSEPSVGVPSQEAMIWLHKNLSSFFAEYGYLPGYGSYVTEAYLRTHVVLGPGVSEQEKDFLVRNGINVYDRRNSKLIGSLG